MPHRTCFVNKSTQETSFVLALECLSLWKGQFACFPYKQHIPKMEFKYYVKVGCLKTISDHQGKNQLSRKIGFKYLKVLVKNMSKSEKTIFQ
jgi:hypothetical protein